MKVGCAALGRLRASNILGSRLQQRAHSMRIPARHETRREDLLHDLRQRRGVLAHEAAAQGQARDELLRALLARDEDRKRRDGARLAAVARVPGGSGGAAAALVLRDELSGAAESRVVEQHRRERGA